MKLINCVYGEIFFVVVNYDKKSKNFGKHKSFKLSHKNNQQILVPPNYLNGFLCLSENCVLHYKLSYKEAILIMINNIKKWSDKNFNIKWPKRRYILSQRDK